MACSQLPLRRADLPARQPAPTPAARAGGREAAAPGPLRDDAGAALGHVFEQVGRDEAFGNARYARTLFEQALNQQAVRLARDAQAPLDTLGLDELMTLTGADFEAATRALNGPLPPAPRRRWWRSAA